MRRFFALLGVLLLLLIVIVLIRTFSQSSKQLAAMPIPPVTVRDSAIVHLQKAIQFKTISSDKLPADSTAFTQFHQFLQSAYPLIFSKLRKENINQYSLLFYWKGSDSSLKPIVLMAHQDVVPVEEASANLWHADPFAGTLKDGYVWGRGAVDDKGSLIALLEGVEQLLEEGFQPATDVYISLGHDEEATGQHGAKAIVPLMMARHIQPAFVLDEGGEITEHEIPGVTRPVALVGIAEKGYVTLDLSIRIPGGHSSMPAPETAIDQLAKAVYELKEHPFSPQVNNTAVSDFMNYIGPEMPFVQKMAFANRWLFNPIIQNTYSKKPGSDAMIRTTTAPTMFTSGIKENVIPTVATATVNFRTLPGTTVDDVVQHVKEVINDSRISVTPRGGSSNPQAVADVADRSFRYINQTIRNWRNNVVVAPYLVIGATDGRYFTALTPNVFRFVPFYDMKGFHGTDERIKADEFTKGIGFYYNLIKNWK